MIHILVIHIVDVIISYCEFKMRENKLCVKVTVIAEASRSSGQSIILR